MRHPSPSDPTDDKVVIGVLASGLRPYMSKSRGPTTIPKGILCPTYFRQTVSEFTPNDQIVYFNSVMTVYVKLNG